MGKFLAGFLGCFFGVSASIGGVAWYLYADHKEIPKKADVYPSALNSQPSLEIGEFILEVMGSKKSIWDWNWKSNSNIVWQDGISYGESVSYRSGSVRINVLGNVSTVLKEREKELGWDISLMTGDMPAKFGPEIISLEPSDCFGTGYGGCTFDPLPSLDKQKITHNLVCSFSTGMGGRKSTYALHSTSKNDVAMTVGYNVGSGGENNFLSFWQGDLAKAIKVCDADAKEYMPSTVNDIAFEDQASTNKEYTRTVQEALKETRNTGLDKGKSCEFYLVVNEYGTSVSGFAGGEGADESLCSDSLNVLLKTSFPKSTVDKPVFVHTKISR